MKSLVLITTVVIIFRESHAEDLKKETLPQVQVVDYQWHKDSLNTMMLVDFVITNGSPFIVKDIVVVSHGAGTSGTVIDRNRRTIYERIPAGDTLRMTDFNMGFVVSQVARESFDVIDLTLDDPLAEMSRDARTAELARRQKVKDQIILDAQKRSETAAAAAIAAATKKKAELDANVLKSNQRLADEGNPYGLYRMGERYMKGLGVPQDLAKARDYLARAAAAGSTEAKALLEKETPGGVQK